MDPVRINQERIGGEGFCLAIGPWEQFPTVIEVLPGETGLEVRGKNWKFSTEVFERLHKGWKYSLPIEVEFKRPVPQVNIKVPPPLALVEVTSGQETVLPKEMNESKPKRQPKPRKARESVEDKKSYILFSELRKSEKT